MAEKDGKHSDAEKTNRFVYDSDIGKEPLTIEHLLKLMGTNYARKASYLIPDLQRDYVWDHKKIINLIDTLMKGWPFGQILVAQTGKLSARFSPRAFYSKIVQVGDESCVAMSADLNSDDATLVLDGQQRLQSLFLALSPCSDGLVLDQRTWIESRDPRNAYYLRSGHASPPAFLALNVANLAVAYEECHDVSRIDYSAQAKLPVLEWVFEDVIRDSQLWYRRTLLPPFLHAWGEDNTANYLLLKDLWLTENIDILLEKHGVASDCKDAVKAFFECFDTIKSVPVPRLRVLPKEESGLDDDEYNEMILSVFTRLNAGGVELSGDEITFSWIKRYWSRDDMTAVDAMNGLRESLSECSVNLKGIALVRILSGMWADIERHGQQLSEADLLDGQLLKKVAVFLGENWNVISEQMVNVANLLKQHQLEYGSQYYSLHGFTILAAWMIIGRLWANEHGSATCAEQIEFDSLFGAALGGRIDRLILSCQWASSIGNYDAELNALHLEMKKARDFKSAHRLMKNWLDDHIKKFSESAKMSINHLDRATRAGVSAYTTQLWCWQRLTGERMRVSEILAREQGGITAGAPNVDHCVSHAFWEEFVGKFPSSPKGSDVYNDLMAKINQIGNCNVLCKQINCSKNASSMRDFFERIGLAESDAVTLCVPPEMFAPDRDMRTPDMILAKIEERTTLIRRELCLFLDGDTRYQLHRS